MPGGFATRTTVEAFAASWIEIFSRRRDNVSLESKPLRLRRLKLFYDWLRISFCLSKPLRLRGLKLMPHSRFSDSA